ncbi:nicastrin isoform X2 [Punica granatum]|uniref:Nicastrin n=1 Tax=Punica granatum TaxID=22663 RepID=A0A6P8DWM8_PUNGR|nr:nicastrin isoform X2 [Punica granatum]
MRQTAQSLRRNWLCKVSKDSGFAGYIGGALVESGSVSQNNIKGFSPAQKFPEAEFAPYSNISYEWNPLGSGILKNAYNFPVFLLSDSSSLILQELASKNEKRKDGYTSSMAEFDLVMQTTKSGTHDSESCLKEETCLPLGGYSVWSALPPINVSLGNQSKPVILVTASMDSASFFRDKSLGAESPISGLIALLAAVDALSHLDGLDDSSRQLVFLVFTGEAWGYLGSRRFLLELDLQSDAVLGLNGTLIEMIVEIGSVGKSGGPGAKKYYAHTAGASSVTNKTLDGLKRAQDSLGSDQVKITSASSANPGIPPSSLMAFIKKNTEISGVVLEDFDTAFVNKFYHSHLDDSSNINSSAIATTASLVARTLYILASDEKNLSTTSLSTIKVNISLVEQLVGCLLSCDPGMSCELVHSYISATTACPSNYVGVILGEPSSTPYSGAVADISRFLWNFLADKTSVPMVNLNSTCSEGCSDRGGVCIRAETDQKGVCVISTTRYVPAYSTRLKYESGTWIVLSANASDPMDVLDPIWTESNWDAIGLRVYRVQDASYDRLVLLGGTAITVFAYLVILTARTIITKAMKQD